MTRSLYVHRDRLAGGLIGLLIGDALGVPFEFHGPAALPPASELDFVPPQGFDRSHGSVPPGTWSDDGAQALCLLDSLERCDRLDLEDFAQRLVQWYRDGLWAVDGRVFDVGIQTRQALEALVRGQTPRDSGGRGEYENGNGSLMRVLPLALWHAGSDADLIRDAALQSVVTHAHPRAQAACALYCLWARAELATHPDAWGWAVERLRSEGPGAGLDPQEIDRVAQPIDVTGAGYVLDTLHVAKQAMDQATDYASAVRAAIAVGNDTDTTAAVTGGIAGIRYGLYGIPLTWRERLRGHDLVRPLLRTLIVQRAGHEGQGPVAPGAGAAALRSGVETHPEASSLDVFGATLARPASSPPARTSQTHPLHIGTLPVPSGGAIGITFCPGKKQPWGETGAWDRDLEVDVAALKTWGATHLVTLIPRVEMEALAVSALPEVADRQGIRWHHAPILDGHTPDELPRYDDPSTWFAAVWPALRQELSEALARGERVVVHCKGGLGRAGTAAALLAIDQYPEWSAQQVIDAVRQARPNAIETVVQEQYVARQWAATHAHRPKFKR